MNHNPPILTADQLLSATQIQIAQSQYEYIVAATSLAFSLVILYFVFKTAVWFLPKFWHKPSESKQ